MPRFERRALIDRFHGMLRRGEPIIGGGAGTGLSAQMRGGGRHRPHRHLQFRPLSHGRAGLACRASCLWQRQ